MGWKDAPEIGGWQSAPLLDEQPSRRSALDEAKRQGGLLGRSTLNAVAALPLTALEGGAGLANLATGGDFSFRKQWDEGLDKLGFPRPEAPVERITDFAAQALIGSKIPAPGIANPAPANFTRNAMDPRAATFAASREAGYVVPPSTTNPTGVNRALEGIAGKLTTAQLASAKNQGVTNSLAKRALGLSDDAPLTQEALEALRNEAGGAYQAIRGAGAMQVDDALTRDLDGIVAQFQGPSRSFPLTPPSPAVARVNALRQGEGGQPLTQFDAGDALDQIRLLRDEASKAYAGGDKSLGAALKKAATSMEDAIERNLEGMGEPGAQLLKNFREARKLIAKTYSVEKAFNPATGNVSGTKLGQQLSRGKPLSGELEQAGRFAQAFPKAALEFNESLPGISPLDFYATGGASALTKEPMYLLYPFLRQAVREGLLSGPGQALAQPRGPFGLPPPAVMGGLTGLLGIQ